MSAKELGRVAFKLGGLDRTSKCTINDALKLEEMTGRGVMELTARARNAQLTIRETAAILKVAIESNGQTGYELDDIVELMTHEGVAVSTGYASMVLVSLITVPKERADKSGNGKAAAKKEHTSPPLTT